MGSNATPGFVGGFEAAPSYVDPFAQVPTPTPGNQMVSRTVPEISPLREWEERHYQELDEMSRKEQEEKMERRQRASEEAQAFHKERAVNVEKHHEQNLAQTQQVDSTRNVWERITDYVDLRATANVDARDTSRMRSLLIALKTSPPVAAA